MIYTKEMIDWLRENATGHFWKDTTEKFNKKFNCSVTQINLKHNANNRGIFCGLNMTFKKDHEAWNKGMKGWFASGTEKSRFKKGHIPKNKRPIGSERIDNKDGYVLVKVADPSTWKLKHIMTWEKYHHEKIDSSKDCIVFLDGNRQNCDIDNLTKVPKSVCVRMSHMKLWNKDPELNKTALKVAKIKKMIGEIQRKYKK